MAHGTTKGTVTGVFKQRIEDLEEKAQKMSEKFRYQEGPRPWHTPKELDGIDLLLVPGMHNPAWDRYEINSIYSNSVLAGPGKQGGTVGDLIAMKWQNDFLAAEERAWRMRHMSLIRGACLMHSRLDGHAQKNKSIFSTLKEAVENYIQAGSSDQSP
jgi:hypothetical protein